jgi:carboxyl-terminal processing protease
MKKWVKKLIITASLLIVIVLSAFTSNYFEVSKNLEIFATLYRELHVYYVDETKPGELMKTGIDAMLKSLDPYTTYIPESKIEDYRFMTTGQYGGIGALIRTIDSITYVAEPYEGFAAFKAGLKAGDEIHEVDGKKVVGKNTQEISELLRGQSGTELIVSYFKNGSDKLSNATIIREEIKVADVPYYGLVAPETGYIKLNAFHATASKEVKDALIDLRDKQQAKNIILDLRGNGGGLLREAVRIVNLFVPKGQLVVSTKGKIDEWNKTHETFEQAVDLEIPLIILIDKGSASASEIVSGALQDLDRAVIIGEESFGKGLVQQTHDLYYNSKLKLTVAKYYIPSGRCIQRLDYSNRSDNGKVIDVPDSELKTFKTKNGRIVKDGRGINPDVQIKSEPFANVVGGLANNSVFFKYANEFVNSHSKINNAKDFKLTDEDYLTFCEFVKRQEYDYETETGNLVKELAEVSKKEAYYNQVKPELEKLQALFSERKITDLSLFKADIKEVLENEVVSRYYYQKGRIENSLAKDPIIDTAQVYFQALKYQSILTP